MFIKRKVSKKEESFHSFEDSHSCSISENSGYILNYERCSNIEEIKELKKKNFEKIFRNKLIYSIKESNNFSNLIHLDELKIPFPEDEEKLEDYDYVNEYIKNLKIKLEGKLKITKSHIDISPVENVDFFAQNAFEDITLRSKSKITNLNLKNNYIGINIKKNSREDYVIYLLYATD